MSVVSNSLVGGSKPRVWSAATSLGSVLCALAVSPGCSASGDGASSNPFATNGGAGGSGSSIPGTGGSTTSMGGSSSGAAGEGISPVGVSGQGGAGGAISSAGAGAGGSASGAGGSTAGNTGGTGGEGTAGTGATAPSCDDGTAFLCDGFESATAGVFPNDGTWLANACTSHTVDATVARTGAQSLRAGAEMYPACMAHADVSSQTEIHARSWIRLGASSTLSGHEVGLLEFGPTNADNPEVRVGFRDNDSVCVAAPGLEVTVDGVAGGERTTCSGVALDAERWYCLEVHFARSPGRIVFGVKVDGTSVVPETEYTDATAWGEGPMFLKLGRSSYGGNMTWPVWHDDVIVSSEPVGCAD
jgi:hypothetical protein